MRTEKEFEEERFFGIQKFSTPEEAFKVLEGKWGTDALDTQEKFLVATDETFKKAILIRAVEKYLEYKKMVKSHGRSVVKHWICPKK